MFENFSIVDGDLPRIYILLHAKFGLAGVRGLRAYFGHTGTQTHRQLFNYI